MSETKNLGNERKAPLTSAERSRRYREKKKREQLKLKDNGFIEVTTLLHQDCLEEITRLSFLSGSSQAAIINMAVNAGLKPLIEQTLPVAIPGRLKEVCELVESLKGEHAYAAQLTEEQPTDPNTIEKLNNLNKRCKEAWEVTEALMKEKGLRKLCSDNEFSEFLENYEYVNQLMLEVTELLSNVVEQMRLAICEPQQEGK